ncbi:nucleocapsid [Embossos virus]|uniref:Nucleoprotein n=1 Tax=Embossos virus TaxID=2767008 RepID=A0A7G8PYJ6_9VIRU|nr:nucleocapsid [Embossos virus]QNJ99602.1 nucleocapsid [Embossos virus]
MADYQRIAVEFASSDVDRSQIEVWLNAIAYEGFDAANIVKLVTDKKDWEDDVKKMIVIALTRGNKPSKMTNRMSDDGKKMVQALEKKYSLKSGRPGRNDITLTRVASAFAGWTVQAIPHVVEFLPVTGTTMDSISKDFPRSMMHPSFGGLIDPTMPKEAFEAIADAHRLFLIQFSRTINVAVRASSNAEVIASFDKPLAAAMQSRFLTSDQKRKILRSVGIIDSNLQVSPAVQAAAKVFRSLTA